MGANLTPLPHVSGDEPRSRRVHSSIYRPCRHKVKNNEISLLLIFLENVISPWRAMWVETQFKWRKKTL